MVPRTRSRNDLVAQAMFPIVSPPKGNLALAQCGRCFTSFSLSVTSEHSLKCPKLKGGLTERYDALESLADQITGNGRNKRSGPQRSLAKSLARKSAL